MVIVFLMSVTDCTQDNLIAEASYVDSIVQLKLWDYKYTTFSYFAKQNAINKVSDFVFQLYETTALWNDS